MKDFLKNVTNGLAFASTEKGLVPVAPQELIEETKVLNVERLLEIGFFVRVTEEETKEQETKEEAPVEVVEETKEPEAKKEEAKPKKPQAPKCAKKVNKPALD